MGTKGSLDDFLVEEESGLPFLCFVVLSVGQHNVNSPPPILLILKTDSTGV